MSLKWPNQSNSGKAPKGRNSWKEFYNNVKGNLKDARNYLEPSEIVYLLIETDFKDKKRDAPKGTKRMEFLLKQRSYHQKMMENIEAEIERTERVILDEFGDKNVK